MNHPRLLWMCAILLIAIAPASRAAVAARDITLMQRNAANTTNNTIFVPAESAITTASLASFRSSIGVGTEDSPVFTAVSAPSTTDLTLTAGSSGASLALGQGANGSATLTTPGTGQFKPTAISINSSLAAGTFGKLISATTNAGLPAFFATDATSASLAVDFPSANVSRIRSGGASETIAFSLGTTEVARLSPTNGNLLIGGTTDISGSGGLKVFGTTAATSTTSGSFQNAGGFGNAGAAHIGGLLNVTGEIQSVGSRVNYNLTVYGAGTAYALTNTAAAIDLGTTDPVKVLDKAGTYLVFAQVNLAYNGATVAAETATIKVRRTNNTAADLSAVVVLDLPVATTLTHTYGVFQIPPFVYTTAATDDSISIFANVSAALGAGTIDATAIGTSLVAIRLY